MINDKAQDGKDISWLWMLILNVFMMRASKPLLQAHSCFHAAAV
ncbi:MAG: hypothetical protein ACLRRA_01495 [Acutalibacteraceae bacterium]